MAGKTLTDALVGSVSEGDCLAWMKRMPSQSVDLVVCSPPYEDLRTYGIGFRLKGQDWVDWAVARYLECYRICRGLVAWVVEGKTAKFRWSATPALMMADLHRHGVRLRKPPAFRRVGIPGSGGPDYLRNDYEFIVCASPGKLPWSDNTAMGHPPKWAPGGAMSHRTQDGKRKNAHASARLKNKHRNQWGHSGTGERAERRKDGSRGSAVRPSHKGGEDGYNLPVKANPGNVIQQTYTSAEVEKMLEQSGNILDYKVGGGVMGSRLCHENEAPFPEDLAEFFIRSFCPPDGIVCDPFSGSGTTLAVADRLGRKFIGFDLRESQIQLTNRRLEESRNVNHQTTPSEVANHSTVDHLADA